MKYLSGLTLIHWGDKVNCTKCGSPNVTHHEHEIEAVKLRDGSRMQYLVKLVVCNDCGSRFYVSYYPDLDTNAIDNLLP